MSAAPETAADLPDGPALRREASRTRWRSNWKHLRLPFQLTLAPLFLWGWFLSGAPLTWSFARGFVALHLLLYTGITAFNSYYDRDEGPIGGLERPPAVEPSLLALALCLKAAGLVVALTVGWAFAAIYLIFVVLSVLYSHPAPRWKSYTVTSALVVSLGQGGLGFLAGWAAARGGIGGAWSDAGVLGFVSAAATTLGIYPLTQVYQIEEDRERGDRTICVALGAAGGVRFSMACFALAWAVSVALTQRRYGALDTAILTAAYSALLVFVWKFGREQAGLTRAQAFRRVLLLQYCASAGFVLFIGARLFHHG